MDGSTNFISSITIDFLNKIYIFFNFLNDSVWSNFVSLQNSEYFLVTGWITFS